MSGLSSIGYEEDLELDGVAIDMGEFNIEIPEILHVVFLFSKPADVVRMTRVSKTFKTVATDDRLWGYIMSNRKEYFGKDDLPASKFTFFYDVNPRKNDLFPKIQSKLIRGHKRKIKLKKKREQEERERIVKEAIDTTKTVSMYGALACGVCAICCGSFAIPQLVIVVSAVIQMIWSESIMEDDFSWDDEDKYKMHAVHAGDAIEAICCSFCGWNFVCCYFQCCCYCICGGCYGCGTLCVLLPLQILVSFMCQVVMCPTNTCTVPAWSIFWLWRNYSMDDSEVVYILTSLIFISLIVFVGIPIVIVYFLCGICIYGCALLICQD